MQKVDLFGGEFLPFEVAVDRLAQHHAPDAAVVGQFLHQGRFDVVVQRGGGQQVEGVGVERIAHQHRRHLVEASVQRRLAAAQVGIVHDGQVVVDQRIGMEHLHGQRHGVGSLKQQRRARFHHPQQQPRAEALAAGQQHHRQGVVKGGMEAGGFGKVGSEIGFEILHGCDFYKFARL